MSNDNINMVQVSETENFSIFRTRDEDGVIYHIEMGGITLHLMPEEWEEFVLLVKGADG
ncbi:MAG: hypothetical protein QNJ45_06110 [Ardenticatenaceae bacterium]|nr:hypothetical protein [Ardenticatenaceae bacterium]